MGIKKARRREEFSSEICYMPEAWRPRAETWQPAARLKSGPPASRLDDVFRSITLPDTTLPTLCAVTAQKSASQLVLRSHTLDSGMPSMSASQARRAPGLTRPLSRIVRSPEIGRDVRRSASSVEPPCEHLQPATPVQFRPGAELQHSSTPLATIRGRGRRLSAW